MKAVQRIDDYGATGNEKNSSYRLLSSMQKVLDLRLGDKDESYVNKNRVFNN